MRRTVLMSHRFCVRGLLSNQKGICTETPRVRFQQWKMWNDKQNLQKKVFGSRTCCQMNTVKCWSCHRPHKSPAIGTKESFFCSSCGSLQEVNRNYDYFSLFGVAPKFQVDQNDLTTKFRQFQSVLHPDKFSNKNEIEQNLSAEVSSLINKAYKTLSTPVKRAEYILEMKGIAIPEDNNAVDKDFLLEIMERNEEVDDADDPMELKNLLKRLQTDMEKSMNDFDLHVKADELDRATSCLILLRYYLSLETSIKSKLNKLEIGD